MAQRKWRGPRALNDLVTAEAWRETALSVVSYWNRNQAVRIITAVAIAWVVGAVGIHLAERGDNEAFDTWGESFWSVWVILFSGIDNAPKTVMGRVFAMILLGTGVGLAGLFTGTVASILVEQQLRRREVAGFEMEDHLVLCNWSPRGLSWIREVHSKIIQDKRPVVIIHDETEKIDLPDTHDETAFQDVYVIKGDPTNEVILRRARVQLAYSVVVLVDDRQGDHADGKTILTCIAVRNTCRGGESPNIAVECRNPNLRHHLLKAGADEVISSDELGLRLLARTSLYHGITRVYQELLTVGRDANEMYLLPVPPEFVGRNFVEISGMFVRHRDDKRSCLLIGFQRGDDMILNPIGNEAGPLKADDHLIVLGRVFFPTPDRRSDRASGRFAQGDRLEYPPETRLEGIRRPVIQGSDPRSREPARGIGSNESVVPMSGAIEWLAGGPDGYMTLAHCMRHDTFWIALTVVLDVAVALGYVVIALHWRRNERRLPDSPAKSALSNMKSIFMLCGICGYLFIPVKMFWPAWRLYDLFLLVLVYLTWKYALGASSFDVIYEDLGRTSRLAEDLERSREEGKRKSYFLNALSHDLKTPLNGLLLQAELAEACLGAPDDGTMQDALRQIRLCARTSANLLNTFLEIGRIDWADDSVRVDEFPLDEVFLRLADAYRTRALGKGLSFETISPQNLSLRTDRSALERILIHLTENAIKFTSRGGVRLAGEVTASGPAVSVIDTGEGVAAEDQARIFDDFTQVHNRERDSRNGFGLGLAIAKRLAARIGGHLAVESTPGRGSRFTVFLPRTAVAVPRRKAVRGHEAGPGGPA